jgi:hypothetical protein
MTRTLSPMENSRREVGQFHEEAVFGGGNDERVEILAHAVGHEFDLLPLDQLALGVGGAAFGLRAFVGQRLEIFLAGRGLAGEDGAQQAVHHQVGITAYGRSEMGVGLGGEGEVADILRAVARLAQGAQHQNSMSGSGRSKSMEPRRTRFLLRTTASSCMSSKRADTGDAGVKLTIGFAAMADTANLNDFVTRTDEEEPVIADP